MLSEYLRLMDENTVSIEYSTKYLWWRDLATMYVPHAVPQQWVVVHHISIKRHATRQHRVVCGDRPVPWELHSIINLCALFDVGVGATCASNRRA